MREAHLRGSKLSSVRLTLSKLDAKYSKKSVTLDEDTSDEMEAEDELRSLAPRKILPTSKLKVEDVRSDIFNADILEQVPQRQEVSNLHTDSSAQAEAQELDGDAESKQKNSPLIEENPLLTETASSIESVITDSSLGFNNVHSVSSLAESVLPLDEVEVEKLQTSNAKPVELNLSNSLNSITSSENCSSICSRKGKNSLVKVALLDSSNKKFIQKSSARTSATNESCEPIKTNKLEQESFLIEEIISSDFKKTFPTVIDKSASSKSSSTACDSLKPEGRHYLQVQERLQDYCKCNISMQPKTDSVGIQTPEYFSCQMRKPPNMCQTSHHRSKPTKSAERSRTIPPVIKATKLPCFLKENFSKSASNIIFSLEKEAPTSANGNELSELISYHLYLTKEFLERQHRIYIANCKAVQLLEKGYQENKHESSGNVVKYL